MIEIKYDNQWITTKDKFSHFNHWYLENVITSKIIGPFNSKGESLNYLDNQLYKR